MTQSRKQELSVGRTRLCRQSPDAKLGVCYGYTREWAEHGDQLFDNAKQADFGRIVLPITKRIRHYQWNQCWTDTALAIRPHLFESGLHSLIDTLADKLKVGDT